MSAPLVAGGAALLREGLQERFGITHPSSALVKAVLLNGADDLAPGQYGVGVAREIPPRPNPVEGWGRVDVGQSLGLGGAPAMLSVGEPARRPTPDSPTNSVSGPPRGRPPHTPPALAAPPAPPPSPPPPL